MRELLLTSNLVVVGTVLERTDETFELPYNAAEIRATLRPGDPPIEPFPFTYYSFQVDQVVHDEVGVENVIELRLAGHEVDGRLLSIMDAPAVGDRLLMVLGNNPDGSFGPITAFHSFTLDGPEARYVSGESGSRVLGFTNARAPQAFIAQIRAELNRRGPSPVEFDRNNLVPRPIAPAR